MANKAILKSYVRLDASGKVVQGSNILRKNKPKIGKWMWIPTYECCDPFLTVCSTTTA